MNRISANRRAEGQVQCQFTDIISYWLNENRMLKIHVQYLKSRIFDKVHLKVCFIREKTVTEGLEVVRVKMGRNCVWRTKQQRSTNDIDTTRGTPFLIYFLTVFIFIKELAFIIN